MIDDIIKEKEKVKINFLKSQAEKLYYLGEFKENVLVALEQDDIEKDLIHEEIIEYMKSPKASLLKLKRQVKLEKFKFYINEAEKIGLRYTLVDDISLEGNVALIVVTEEPQDNKSKNLILESKTKLYTDVGLSEGFAFAVGKKICKKHYKELEEKLPEQLDKFEELSLMDRFFGIKCEIERFEEKKGR